MMGVKKKQAVAHNSCVRREYLLGTKKKPNAW